MHVWDVGGQYVWMSKHRVPLVKKVGLNRGCPRESQHVMRQGGLLCIKDGNPDWLCGVYAPTTHSFHTPLVFFCAWPTRR